MISIGAEYNICGMNLLIPRRENHNYYQKGPRFDKLGRLNWVNEIAVVGAVE